ncbi:MAG TPA: peptidylprolyl isomerase [Pyrinomonadaceae bacterium]|nr:peptidylprolyl isomerase [Pyrinomonadaceae bacterium]
MRDERGMGKIQLYVEGCGVIGLMRAVKLLICLLVFTSIVDAQNVQEQPKKSNERPAASATARPEPFDGASVEKMAKQCVKLETDAGVVEIEMLAEAAPENARNFLNLAATGLYDTTTFSRVVKDFVIQGGNLSTGQKWNLETAKRAARKVPDEPSYVKHERGIVSMARPDEPNSATTHFFILMREASQLDGKFSAFGRVKSGMDVVEAINHAPVEGEKPEKPVQIKKAIVEECEKKPL